MEPTFDLVAGGILTAGIVYMTMASIPKQCHRLRPWFQFVGFLLALGEMESIKAGSPESMRVQRSLIITILLGIEVCFFCYLRARWRNNEGQS